MDAHTHSVLQMINQNKAKMTSEQFWCVALVCGALGVIAFDGGRLSFLPDWLVAIASLALSAWGVFFVYSRHANYVEHQCTFANLVKEDKIVPESWKQVPLTFSDSPSEYVLREFLPGHGAYIILIVALYAVVLTRCLLGTAAG